MDVKAISYILRNNANLIAQVPAAKIFSGVIPINTVLPAIVVKHIDDIEEKFINAAGAKRFTARVQVSVQAKTWADKVSILELVRLALAGTFSTVNGISVYGISSEGSGPDLDDTELGIFERSRDFLISFSLSA
ncbi:MAG: hypothetical protein WC100_02345 [Sterolibacterium sp.]